MEGHQGWRGILTRQTDPGSPTAEDASSKVDCLSSGLGHVAASRLGGLTTRGRQRSFSALNWRLDESPNDQRVAPRGSDHATANSAWPAASREVVYEKATS